MKLKQLSIQSCGEFLEIHVILRNGRKARVIVPDDVVIPDGEMMFSPERPDFYDYCEPAELRRLAGIALRALADAEVEDDETQG